MELDLSHPSIEDLRHAARKRIPKFAFEYLDSATGRELGLKVNRDALDAIGFMPSPRQASAITRMWRLADPVGRPF